MEYDAERDGGLLRLWPKLGMTKHVGDMEEGEVGQQVNNSILTLILTPILTLTLTLTLTHTHTRTRTRTRTQIISLTQTHTKT